MNIKTLAALVAAVALTGCIDTGNGEKIGVVMKTARQGVFCTTNEVEIVRGGMNNGTGAVGSAFHVTVPNDADFKRLTEAMEKQEEVKITYRSEFATFCSSDSNHFLTSLTTAKPVGVERPAPVAVQGQVETRPVTSSANETRDQKVKRLLRVQAELLQELAKDQ